MCEDYSLQQHSENLKSHIFLIYLHTLIKRLALTSIVIYGERIVYVNNDQA
jgi:hypothetical protein